MTQLGWSLLFSIVNIQTITQDKLTETIALEANKYLSESTLSQGSKSSLS